MKFGDGSTVEIKGKGSVSLKWKNGEEKLLHEVYFIPNLCSNIISLGQLSEEGNKVILHKEYLKVYDENQRLLMNVKRSPNRLYRIVIESGKSLCLLAKLEDPSWLWHARLGHVNFPAMVMMHKEQMVTGMPRIQQPKEVCGGCMMSKQTRRPFPSKTSFSATRFLELVHGDICGPISPSTDAGNRYFLLLVDDYSRFMWVYMLKNKSEAFEVFKKFQAKVENGTSNRIGVFRTDRGGEFVSKEFTAYCEDRGIVRHFTAPYTPQQNGVVERRNRTVVEMARSFLKHANLPSGLWAEAIRHSIYILNRVPTRALTGKTPYEVLKEHKPNLSHIRVFGCIAHMKVPDINAKKLDDRSVMVVNLGKDPGTKAYRLYDPVNKRVFVSRDVRFEEGKY